MSGQPVGLKILDRAGTHSEREAVVGTCTLTYAQLTKRSRHGAAALLEHLKDKTSSRSDLGEQRVAFLITPSEDYVIVQWSIWRAGGVAVPLCVSHPVPELEYVLRDSDVSLLVYSSDLAELAKQAALAAGVVALAADEICSESDLVTGEAGSTGDDLPAIDPDRRAMIIYTSGTTGRPKGVVSTHHNIEAQVQALVAAWGWSENDSILNVLPLHHLHGIINVTCCALWSGARLEIMPRFDAEAVWERFSSRQLSLFMAVPTIYSRLLRAFDEAPLETQERWRAGAESMRLMVSGSAALPVRVLKEWQRVSGQLLLERYGMSETGMILSNPLDGERVPGSVGQAVPGIEVRFVDGGESAREEAEEAGNGAKAPDGDLRGVLEVRGAAVFGEYWRRPKETKEAFVDGWFQTGDMAVFDGQGYRLLGRTSVDILKTGGYKISALEIEEVLREHPDIAEVAVVGVADEEWGQRVAAVVVLKVQNLDLDVATFKEQLRAWGKERLAPYKVPTLLRVVSELPRNALGKVTKPQILPLFED